MFTQLIARSGKPTRLLCLLLILLMLMSQLLPLSVRPARAGVMQTVGDFLSLGANTARELNTAINSAGSQFRATLEQLNNNLNSLLQSITQTFQSNLNVTINSLDAESQNEFTRLQTLISQIDQTLQQDIQVASQAAQNIIRTAALEVETVAQNLEGHLKNLIVVGGETGAYLIDRATYDAIPIISFIALAVGALVIIILVFVRKFPTGIARYIALIFIVGYVALFASMIFVPTLRGYVMSYTGIGLQQRVASIGSDPRIIGIFPQSVIIPLTPEAQVWGSNLNPSGKTLVVKVGNQTAQSAPGDDMIVVKVGSLSLPDGSSSLQLVYNGTPGPSEPITLYHPTPTPALPDLTIQSFTISPASPTQGNNAHASIRVLNQGAGSAGSFVVYWRPIATSGALNATISGLAAGATQTVGFDYPYPQAGSFD
ncbi:MAG TPA: CARDB domain-containing protein, partial [Aggregatilineales bacterium]|nr:CARDB domain-containing protein [Aggregatilineales bacterium]